MLKRLPRDERTVYLYLAVMLSVMVVLFSWPSLHRLVLTHPEDMSEKEIREEKEVVIISRGIIGRWQSTDDERYEREFTKDEVIERYDGEIVLTDSYTLFDGNQVPPQLVEHAEPHLVYLMIGALENEPLFFSINKFDFTSLDMFYLGRGEMLRFKRVQ